MLNIINRILSIFLFLVIISCAALAALSVWILQAAPARTQVVNWVTASVETLGRLTMAQQLTVTGIALLVMLVVFIALILELRPAPGEQMIPVRTTEGGETVVSSKAVVRRLQWSIDRLDDVVKVSPTLTAKRDGVDVLLAVRTTPQIDLPMKDAEIKQVARQVLEEQMGLKVKRLRVNIDHSAFEEETGTAV